MPNRLLESSLYIQHTFCQRRKKKITDDLHKRNTIQSECTKECSITPTISIQYFKNSIKCYFVTIITKSKSWQCCRKTDKVINSC